jgi:hypothetical protein
LHFKGIPMGTSVGGIGRRTLVGINKLKLVFLTTGGEKGTRRSRGVGKANGSCVLLLGDIECRPASVYHPAY